MFKNQEEKVSGDEATPEVESEPTPETPIPSTPTDPEDVPEGGIDSAEPIKEEEDKDEGEKE